MPYKFIIHYPNGDYDSYEDDDKVYDTEDEAEDAANYDISCYHQGSETLHYSNPGDWDDESDADISYEVVEI